VPNIRFCQSGVKPGTAEPGPANHRPVTERFGLQNKTIGYQFPQIFDLQILDPVFFFDTVKLAVAAVAGYHKHFGTGGLDLIYLFAGIENALVFISVYQRTAAAAATNLIHTIGVEVHPALQTLIHNPARFIKISIPESHLRFAAVIARVMIGCQDIKP